VAAELHLPLTARDAPVGVRLVQPSEHRRMPWKNGFGTTTEIAIEPPGADVGGGFRWRLSIAEVEQSGPFSAFPGYERTIMVIAGSGMELVVGGRAVQRIDRLFEPFVFSGDSATECRLLGGPIRDFNLMVERSSVQSRLTVLRQAAAPLSLDLSSADRIVHCFEGEIDLAIRPEWSSRLQPDCTAILRRGSGQGALQVAAAADARATAAIIELLPA
jgi:environmental stress-induced protein Ves